MHWVWNGRWYDYQCFHSCTRILRPFPGKLEKWHPVFLRATASFVAFQLSSSFLAPGFSLRPWLLRPCLELGLLPLARSHRRRLLRAWACAGWTPWTAAAGPERTAKSELSTGDTDPGGSGLSCQWWRLTDCALGWWLCETWAGGNVASLTYWLPRHCHQLLPLPPRRSTMQFWWAWGRRNLWPWQMVWKKGLKWQWSWVAVFCLQCSGSPQLLAIFSLLWQWRCRCQPPYLRHQKCPTRRARWRRQADRPPRRTTRRSSGWAPRCRQPGPRRPGERKLKWVNAAHAHTVRWSWLTCRWSFPPLPPLPEKKLLAAAETWRRRLKRLLRRSTGEAAAAFAALAAAAALAPPAANPVRLSSKERSRFGAHTMARFLAVIPVSSPRWETWQRWRIKKASVLSKIRNITSGKRTDEDHVKSFIF